MDFTCVPTTCPYCGVGCNLFLQVADGRLAGVMPHKEHPVSEGSLCVKGWNAHAFVHHADRLTKPQKRSGDGFSEVAWETAFDEIASALKKTVEEHGPESVAVFVSARCTNEENYLLMKLARAALKTPHIDHCARL